MKDWTIELTKALEEYTTEVEEGIKEASKEVADEAVQELRATSPKNTGKYAKGWTKKKEGDGYIVYNNTKPGLAHLLEFGHAKRGGKGRVSGRPHIGIVEDKAIKKFEDRIENIIRSGG